MRERPKSRFENEAGFINLSLVGEVPEYPEVIAWKTEHADECDRLAEIDAVKTGKPHWGRWYLTTASLNTKITRPNVGSEGFMRCGVYDIALDRLSENWERHMKEKNWIGEQGHRDLHLALEALGREKGAK